MIDSHVHFWDPRIFHYAWLGSVPTIAGAHLPEDLDRAGGRDAIEALVFVQCDCAPAEEELEVRWVARLARQDARVQGIVAGLAVERGEEVRAQLERYSSEPLVRGVRRLIQDEVDPQFCARADFVQGVRRLARYGYSFDLCLRAHQLPAALELVQSASDVQFVLDHLGKPNVRAGERARWQRDLRQLARAPNVVCKLSGLVTEADPLHWQAAELAPYIEHALECFGPERVLYGSDWPVQSLASSYAAWIEVLRSVLEPRLQPAELDLFWRGNACRIYRLGDRTPAAAPAGSEG